MPSPYDPPSRYGFPPLPEAADPQLPAVVPWDTPISELSGFWLETRCTCGHGFKPLRLMAATLGWQHTLKGLVPRLSCPKCGERYRELSLVADPAYQEVRHGKPQRRLDLLA